MIVEFFEPMDPPRSTHQAKMIVAKGERLDGSTIYGLADRVGLKNARMFWIWTLQKHRIPEPVPPPISLLIEIEYPWRKSDSKKRRSLGREYMTEKPDWVNTAKTVEDVLKFLRFVEDDNAVSEATIRKYRGDQPGIFVRLTGPVLAGVRNR